MPTPAYASRALNLYSSDCSQHYKVTLGQTDVAIDSSLPIAFGTQVNIGSHSDVAALLTAMQANIVTNAAAANAQAAAVQANLDTYLTSNNVEVATLTQALTDEIAQRTASVAAEVSTRTTAVTALQADLSTERVRIDGILAGSSVDLNSFAELVSAFEAADQDLLGTVASIQASLTLLTNRFNELTES